MKKQLIYFIAMLMVLAQASSCTFAQSNNSDSVTIAMKKYKMGNYTGCLQDCINIVNKSPTNAVAYYYMALAYAQSGKKTEAIDAYSKVLNLKPNSKLADYAATGKRCLATPEKCKSETTIAPSSTPELDALISSPYSESSAVRKDFQQKHLDSIRSEINNGKDLDNYTFDKLNQAETKDVIAVKPTNEDIVKALKVLNDAGISPYSQAQLIPGGSETVNYQNPEMTQLNMLMGDSGQTKDSNSMINILPMMFAQNKDGASNYSPQAMQAVIMNTMMTNLNYDTDKK